MSEDKRRADRVRTSLEVLHATVPFGGRGRLHDLSPEGAHIQFASGRPEIGAKLCVAVTLSNGQPPLLFAGKVVRHTQVGFALVFEKPNLEVERVVRDLPLDVLLTSLNSVQEVPVDCLSGNGEWYSGSLCTPLHESVLDCINRDEPVLHMRGVATADGYAGFLSLYSDAVCLVVPPLDKAQESAPKPAESPAQRPVRCFFESGSAEGLLQIEEGVRVSDYWAEAPRFLRLSECVLSIPGRHEPPVDVTTPRVILVNSGQLTEVADLSATDPSAQ